MNIQWDLKADEIEKESFRLIEKETDPSRFPIQHWRVIRRLVHTTADFSIIDDIIFKNNPIENGLSLLRKKSNLYSDSNMIRSGISVSKLNFFEKNYTRNSIHCYIADSDVADLSKKRGITRALAALDKARPILNGAIVLIGNAPLALAGLARMIRTGEVNPGLVIGMPVGFVNVVESKQMIMDCNVPQIVLKGRRGGSPLAVATLHAIMETAFEE